MKEKIHYSCQECGYSSAKWLGKCPECGGWNSFLEEIKVEAKKIKVVKADSVTLKRLQDITFDAHERILTCFSEFNRALGGGIVKGSLILIGGDPGIGKSTLLLQAAYNLAEKNKKPVIYASGEESFEQISLRAKRMGFTKSDYFFILSENDINIIAHKIREIQPIFAVVDSIQAIYDKSMDSIAGSITQVRNNTALLMDIAKSNNIAMSIVGHVNKEGHIAGPKVLEHLVDTVIQFEGDKYRSYRILRSTKNRFGATSEIGVFEMTGDGLREVTNPSELFLAEYSADNSGCSIVATMEGTRPILVEVQALTYTSGMANPRRLANGMDYNRLVQILAVLEKRLGLPLGKLDVVVNVVGGLEIDEPAADLGVAIALISTLRDIPVEDHTIFLGEIGLMGEIRSIAQIEQRLKESVKLGFTKAIIPQRCLPLKEKITGIQVVGVKRIIDVLSCCFKEK